MARTAVSPRHKDRAQYNPAMREKILLLIFVVTFPLVAYVSTLPPQRFRNNITEWGNQQSDTYQDFRKYREQFGINNYFVVTWPGCDLDDPRVETVAEKIETDLEGRVKQVSSGQRVYWKLQDKVGLSEKAALKRLRKNFVSEKGLETAVGFNLTAVGRIDRAEVVSDLHEILKSSDVDPDSASFAGLGHNLYTLDKEGLESPFRMVPWIVLLAFALTFLFVRNFWLAVFINALGIYTGCLSFNLIYLADIDMNAIIWPLPTLTMLLSVSSSLHFLNYFRRAAETSGDVEQPLTWVEKRSIAERAVQIALKPTLCCTVTTSIGLLSLLLSTSLPVRQFGLYGAMSVVTANALMLLLFPPLLIMIGLADKHVSNKNTSIDQADRRDGWSFLATFTQKFRWPVIAGCIAVLILCVTGIPKIETGSQLDNFFPVGHEALTDVAGVESATGPLNSLELTLQFSDHDSLNDARRLRGLSALCSRIVMRTPVESCISAATVAPRIRRSPTLSQKVVETTRIKRLKDELTETGMLSVEPEVGNETWRVSCRYSTARHLDLPMLAKQVESIVDQTFYRDDQLIFEGESLDVATTGEFILFDSIDRQFFRELLTTYATAFGVIAIVVLLVLRTLRSWFTAILPNLFPAVVVLGVAGHLGYAFDVASLMTASVALGIAVDDTLHFLLWRQETGSDGKAHSIESTMRYCGLAMLQTSVILGVSLFLYVFCGFLPTVRFGVLLSAMMFAALIGDLLLLPAIEATKIQARSASE